MNKPQSKYFLRTIKLEFFFLTSNISISDWYFHPFRSVSHHRHHHHHHHYHRIIIIVINTVGYCPINITNSYLQASLSVLACSQALKTTKKQNKNSVQTFFAEDKLGISFLFRSINITERCSRISSCIILSCLSSVSPSSLLLIIVYKILLSYLQVSLSMLAWL